MKKIALISHGCAKNLVDSELILGFLKQAGYEITLNENETDLVIINKAGKETHIAYGLYKDDLLKALNTIAITRDDIKIGYIR